MRAADLARWVDRVGDLTVEEARSVQWDKVHGQCFRDVVAHAVQNDVALRGVPTSLAEWNARQIQLGALLGFVYECDTLETLPVVARVFPIIVPRGYAHAS